LGAFLPSFTIKIRQSWKSQPTAASSTGSTNRLGRDLRPQKLGSTKKTWGTHHPKTSKTTTKYWKHSGKSQIGGCYISNSRVKKIGLGDLDDSTLKLVVTIIQPEW